MKHSHGFQRIVFVLFGSLQIISYQIIAQQKPNVVLIYADDLGYGDLSCYGATKIKTPNIDKLASQGLRFTNAYATSATCTPSRFSMLTGRYAWRKEGTGIAPGDAGLIIPTNVTTLPMIFQRAGYKTAVVGKWHLGLGPSETGPDWNGEIKPGPLELGFNYCFIMPATADRVPCVYIEDHHVVGLVDADPLKVSYKEKIGDDPTGKEHPELLKLLPSHGHDQTIVNGVSRIGYMTGGNKARWIDEDMADVFTSHALQFIETNKNNSFFLYFATHDIHVPRVPNARFVGKSNMGARGDAILQLDWTVGEVMKTLDRLGLAQNTILMFSSDNGPVIDDGYQDEAVAKLNGHTPSSTMRGGKYSAFEAGTRLPLIIRWPGNIRPGISNVLVSQVDFLASYASFTRQKLTDAEGPDSFDAWPVLIGKSKKGRDFIVEQSLSNILSYVHDGWKYIELSNGPKMNANTNIETGNDPSPQLYNIKLDPAEKNNVATQNPSVLKEIEEKLKAIKEKSLSRK